MLKFHYSPITEVANKERLQHYFDQQRAIGKPVYYILPSNKYLQAARKKITGMAFKTFDDLADLLLKQDEIQYLPVSESERMLFFQELMARSEEKLLDNPVEMRHKAKAYAQTYGQLKRIGLTIADLPPQLQRMAPLFEEYEKEWVEKQGLLDPENRIHKAVFRESTTSLNVAQIVIDGYLDFSTLQYMVLSYFVSQGLDITIYLPAIEEAEIVQETEAQLVRLGFELDSVQASKRLNPIIEVSSATSVEEEIHGVLDEISQQPSLNEIGVIFADDHYEERFQKLARIKEIPITQPLKKHVGHSVFIQCLTQSLLKHNGKFSSRWDYLDLVDTLLRLQFLPSIDYMNKKRAYIETGTIPLEIKNTLEAWIKFRKQAPKKTSLLAYLTLLNNLLESTGMPQVWKNSILAETDTKLLQQIRFEWKAFEWTVHFLTKKLEQLKSQQLDKLDVHYHIFVDWLQEGMQNTSIYIERAPKNGITILSFRDAPLFKGKTLYVLGMNEGTFPKGHKLSGYFQEVDLAKLPIPFASPTRRLFRKKDDAFFTQLFYVANKISFSYVVGVDPHNPLLPSVYLEPWKKEVQERKYSAKNRFNHDVVRTERELVEKIAYHAGTGKIVPQMPKQLEQINLSLNRLEEGTEVVSDRWKSKLKRDKLSVTMLESYAMCPFKFALERILQVKEPLEKPVSLDFRHLGSMLHNIIEKFYKQLGLIGQPFSSFTKEMNEIAEQTLMTIFEEEWSMVEDQHLDFSKLQLSIEKEQWQKKLRKWWLAEKKHFWENKLLSTMHLFRLEEAIELSLQLDDETTIILTGKIDRIDIDENGFVIYDYKSGHASLHFEKEVRPGLKLQLPLYLVAMEKRLSAGHYELNLAEPKNFSHAHGASYISLRDPVKRAGNSVWREEHFSRNNAFSISTGHATKEETLEAEIFLAKYELKKRLKELWENSTNNFSVKPLKCVNSCIYKLVCRVTQDQIEAGEEEWK